MVDPAVQSKPSAAAPVKGEGHVISSSPLNPSGLVSASQQQQGGLYSHTAGGAQTPPFQG